MSTPMHSLTRITRYTYSYVLNYINNYATVAAPNRKDKTLTWQDLGKIGRTLEIKRQGGAMPAAQYFRRGNCSEETAVKYCKELVRLCSPHIALCSDLAVDRGIVQEMLAGERGAFLVYLDWCEEHGITLLPSEVTLMKLFEEFLAHQHYC